VAIFTELSKTLWKLADAALDSDFAAHRSAVFEQCVVALKQLTTAIDEAIYVFSVSDFDCPQNELAWIAMLNTPAEAAEFRAWSENAAT